MRFPVKGLSLPAAVLAAGCLVAGCGSAVKSGVGSLPSRTGTVTATPSLTAPARPSVTVTSTVPVTATSNVPVTSTSTTTVTATATPAEPTTAAATTPGPTTASPGSASGNSSASSLVWLWVLLGVILLGGLIALIARSARRRSAAAADWRSRLIDAYAQGSALHDAMSVAESMGATAPDAGVRWADISRRADDLAQTLYQLREAVPDDGDRIRIGETLVALQAVRSAMEAERAPGGAGPQQAEVVRGRLFSFEDSLRALREGDEQYP